MVKFTFSILERKYPVDYNWSKNSKLTNFDLNEYLEFNDDFLFISFGPETPILEKLVPNYQCSCKVLNLILASFILAH